MPFVYTIVDIMPQFPGGKDSLISFIQKEAKFNFDGMAFVEFIVTKTGSIRDINVLGGFGINNISIPVKKIISNMPNWIPGMHRGRNVDVQMSLTISYDGAFIKHE
ncbi:MAG: energy transducer TonB [Bacteroidetes bacterium]|nr:energy transducer TonB [Bacteroidota bacterium]